MILTLFGLAFLFKPRTTNHKPLYPPRPVALTYHDVTPRKTVWFDCAPGEFRAQIDAMAKAGVRFVSLAQVEAAYRGTPLPPRAVALTFADNYRGFLTYAYPLLQEAPHPRRHVRPHRLRRLRRRPSEDDLGRPRPPRPRGRLHRRLPDRHPPLARRPLRRRDRPRAARLEGVPGVPPGPTPSATSPTRTAPTTGAARPPPAARATPLPSARSSAPSAKTPTPSSATSTPSGAKPSGTVGSRSKERRLFVRPPCLRRRRSRSASVRRSPAPR